MQTPNWFYKNPNQYSIPAIGVKVIKIFNLLEAVFNFFSTYFFI